MRRFTWEAGKGAYGKKGREKTEICLNYWQSCGGEDDWIKAWHSWIERHYGIWLKRTLIQSEIVLWHLRVAEGDHLSERSEGRKLPQHKTRALASLR